MQTFLPYSDFAASAKVLDNKRLNKQIIEAYQIYTGRVPQKNHPACLMWQHHENTLLFYTMCMCAEYRRRFEKNHSIVYKLFTSPFDAMLGMNCFQYTMPPYFANNNVFKISHCVNLIRKDMDFYYDKLGFRVSRLSKLLYGREVELDEFPTGYYWPVEPVGKKAKQDRENWMNFK